MSSREESVGLRTWKSTRDELEYSLARVNLEELSEELQGIDVISEDCKEKFDTIDCSSTEKGSRVRYLLMHVYHRVSCSVSDLNRFYRCLSEKFQLGHVLPCIYDSADGAGSRCNVDVEDHVLTTDDESFLVELLYEAAPKWELIALVLKLSFTAIDNCRYTSNCVIALAKVLHEWILSSKQPCKVCVLASALESNVVGCARIAQELKDKLERKLNPSNLKSCIEEESFHKERTFDYCVHYIKIAEGKSALVEVEGTLNDTLSYQWFKDGKCLNNTLEYFGVNCAILLLYKADLVHQGMYQCHITNSMGVELPLSGQVNVKVILTPEREYLRSVYARESEVPPNSWPPISNTNFTNLALINVWEMHKASYSYTVRGDIDDITDVDKKHVKYQDIFERFEEGSLTLVEGRPGSGKTTLVHKVCRDWAIGEEGKVLKHASLVFFIYLRLLTDEDKDLIDILKKLFYPDSTQSEDLNIVVQKICQTKGENTCFILDGLDEYDLPQRKDSAIYRLIKKKIMPNLMVIVSSRPAATVEIRQMRNVRRIEVLGFSEAQIYEYILAYPFCDGNMNNVSLLLYLRDHPNVLHICYLPVHLAIICFLYDKLGDRIPATESRIYEMFTILTIFRHLKHDGCGSAVTSLTKLQGEHRQYFKRLCKIAFEFTVSAQQVLVNSDISSEAHTLGLVTLDKIADIYNLKNVYSFHHLTFQEYLAAWHVADLDSEFEGTDKQMELITLHAGKPHMKNMWKFYCGIVDLESKMSQFESIIKHSSDNLYSVHCAFESQKTLTCQCVIQNSEDDALAFDSHTFLPHDLSAIEYVISNACYPVHLTFNKCLFESVFKNSVLAGVLSLSFTWNLNDQSRLLNSLLKKMPNIRKLDLGYTIFNPVELVKNITLPNLSIIKVSLFPESEYIMSRDVMEMLKFNSSEIKEVSVNFIEDPRMVWYESEYLDMLRCEHRVGTDLCVVFGFSAVFRGKLPYVNISSFEIKTFAEIASNDFGICVSLALVNCGIDDKLANELANHLKRCQKLKILSLDFNDLSDTGAQSLACTFENHSLLRRLSVLHNNISDIGAIQLIKSLINCKDLCDLDFQCNNISIDGLKKILLIIEEHFPNLFLKIWNKHLDFNSNDISVKFAQNILDLNFKGLGLFIKYFPDMLANHLQILDISRNFLQSAEMSVIVQHLSRCKDLKTLKIGYNELDCFYNLREMGLHNLRNLQYLDLSGNVELFDLICDEQADEIVKCRNLSTLLLNECVIESFAVIHILTHCKKLAQIELANNPCIEKSFPAIALYLSCCPGLRILDLSGNKIKNSCLWNLSNHIKETELLLNDLKFKWNGIDEKGLAMICSLKWQALHTLDVSNNSIGSTNLDVLTVSLKYCFTHLDTFKISHNQINDNAIVALHKAMSIDKDCVVERIHWSSLQTLDLSNNLIGDDGVCLLIEIGTNLVNLNVVKNKITSSGIKILRDYSAKFKKLEYDDK